MADVSRIPRHTVATAHAAAHKLSNMMMTRREKSTQHHGGENGRRNSSTPPNSVLKIFQRMIFNENREMRTRYVTACRRKAFLSPLVLQLHNVGIKLHLLT